MEKNFQMVLSEYHRRIERENLIMRELGSEGFKRRDEFLLSVGREVGQFLNTLIKGARAKTILEIGTSYGYSTIWMAEAAKATKGKVFTMEIDSEKVAYAKAQIRAAGLEEYVDFRVGDALESIRQAKERFDFVLLDIWKELYLPCFDLFYPKLKDKAFIIADNMLFPEIHQKDAAKYRSAVQSSGMFDSVLLPIGTGIEVSKKREVEVEATTD